MGVNARASIDPRWQKSPLNPLEGFKNCVIRIIDPHLGVADAGYSAWTNSGTSAAETLWQGPAQMNIFRQTLNAELPAGAITQVRSARFTATMEDILFPVRKGLLVRIVSCEGDASVTSYQFTVTSGIGSGLGFDRTIEAEVDVSVILPPVVP